MESFIGSFRKSAAEFGNVRSLVTTGLLIAVSVVLEMFSIPVTPFLKINFAFLAIAVIGMLFGPSMCFVAACVCDIIGALVSATGSILPAYTLVAGVQGIIYGLWLYRGGKREIDRWTFVRTVGARLCDVVLINLICNTWLNLHYGFIHEKSLAAALAARVAKNLIELAADIPMLFMVLPAALAAYKRVGSGRRRSS